MAYNKNTNWDNEKKYLDNLSKNGNAGEKAWAEKQKKVLADAQTKYGGSSSGGTSGGTNKNSQYTTTSLGSNYNPSTDYQAIINNAVKNGDYATAAKAEQLRNQKITATGSNYNTTNIYSGYLQPDYGTIGQQQMANNASWEDVLDTYNSRNSKALSTPGLEKYANDDVQQMMWNYIVQNMKDSNQPEDFTYEEEKPTAPTQDPRIEEYLNKYLNRDEFSYDVMSDPLYQQYADIYRREGDRAMRETMAEAAASAGGMNTYAMTAAMQANNYYNSQLNDKVPELYQAAYDKYLKNIDLQLQDLGVLQGMDDTQYARYRDTMADWKDDRNFAYGAYLDDVQQGNWQTNFDYNSMLDNRNFNNGEYWNNKEWDYNDAWRNKEWDANRGDIEYERNQAEEETAKNEIGWLIQNGVTTIDPKTIEAAGLTQETVNQMIAYFKQQQALQMAKGTSSGGGSGKGGTGYTPKVKDPEKKEEEIEEGYYKSGDGTTKKSTPDPEKWDATENWKDIEEDCKGILMTQGKDAVLDYLKLTLEKGAIDIYSYMRLVNQYRG